MIAWTDQLGVGVDISPYAEKSWALVPPRGWTIHGSWVSCAWAVLRFHPPLLPTRQPCLHSPIPTLVISSGFQLLFLFTFVFRAFTERPPSRAFFTNDVFSFNDLGNSSETHAPFPAVLTSATDRKNLYSFSSILSKRTYQRWGSKLLKPKWFTWVLKG